LDRAAWNAAFRMRGVPWDWSFDTYAGLLREGGDRRRAARYAARTGASVEAEVLDRIHRNLFAARLSVVVPLRPGGARVIDRAARAGLKPALVSRRRQRRCGPRCRPRCANAAARRSTWRCRAATSRARRPTPKGCGGPWRGWMSGAGGRSSWPTRRFPRGPLWGLPVLSFPGLLADPGAMAAWPVAHVPGPEAIAAAWARGPGSRRGEMRPRA